MAYIAYRCDFPANPILYVSELPGQGEADWGYSPKRAQALPLSEYWWRRFARDTERCGHCAFCEPQ